jgi:hypothetical protein
MSVLNWLYFFVKIKIPEFIWKSQFETLNIFIYLVVYTTEVCVFVIQLVDRSSLWQKPILLGVESTDIFHRLFFVFNKSITHLALICLFTHIKWSYFWSVSSCWARIRISCAVDKTILPSRVHILPCIRARPAAKLIKFLLLSLDFVETSLFIKTNLQL